MLGTLMHELVQVPHTPLLLPLAGRLPDDPSSAELRKHGLELKHGDVHSACCRCQLQPPHGLHLHGAKH